MPSATLGADLTSSLFPSTSSSLTMSSLTSSLTSSLSTSSTTFFASAYSGNSSDQASVPTSSSSDTATPAAIPSVLSAHTSKSTAGHSLSNDTVAGIVVGSAVVLALLASLITFLFMRLGRRSRSRRRHRRPRNDAPAPKNIRPCPIVTENTSNAGFNFEKYLPQSADDNTVKQRVRETLEQIDFHVVTFYQNLSNVGMPNLDDQMAIYDTPYLTTPLATRLSHSKDTIPLIMHSLAYFVTLSISPTNGAEWPLLPVEFITLPSSVGSEVSTNTGKTRLSGTTG